MSSDLPTPEQSGGALSPPLIVPKPLRVLACILCQQRKVKCDRKSPCTNCIKNGAQCISASLAPRQRRRRFPERELLDRLRHYEDLLAQNNIAFEPLHRRVDHDSQSTILENGSSPHVTEQKLASTGPYHPVTTQDTEFRAKNYWRAMNRRTQDSGIDDANISDEDDEDGDSPSYTLRPGVIKQAWDEQFLTNNHLLFCSRNANVNLSSLHPTQALTFKLWQIYLDNVNPLLKVTHTPTLQVRIIDAASDVLTIDPALEALMFSIYCAAVFSLNQEECKALFGTPREDVLRGYQLGAREALLNCDFLRSDDRNCLTALHLYLITVKPDTDPRALSSMLGVAMRIAQRMGLHCEANNVKHPVLEAEMRRRLWWSLVLFDSRISEISDHNTGMLTPAWDCRVPFNVNDFDLRSEMKSPPVVYTPLTEAIFAVVRSMIGDFNRYDPAHLDFINPVLKSLPRITRSDSGPEATELAALETIIENNYLSSCDPDNPLHFMTIWVTRVAIAKSRFTHYLSTDSHPGTQMADDQRDAGMLCACTMLDCDSKLMRSPLIKGFRWLVYVHFPFPAYVYLVDDLRKRPFGDHADKAWQAMSDNCSARFMDMINIFSTAETRKHSTFFKIFASLVLQAWAARESASMVPEAPPSIVLQVREKIALFHSASQAEQAAKSGDDVCIDEPTDFGGFSSLYGTENPFTDAILQSLPPVIAQASMGLTGNAWGWPAANWDSMAGSRW